jgi:nickel superoxide dismutase
MKKYVLISIVLSVVLLIAPGAFSHCEIPCGIYGDEIRFYMIEEHLATIEKSMKMISELSKEEDKNYNQLVRWINNKEQHADDIQEIVCQYFMTQRVKPAAEENAEKHKKYLVKIALLHKMLIYAMKAKQTTDLDNIKELKTLLAIFRAAYFGAERIEHKYPHK